MERGWEKIPFGPFWNHSTSVNHISIAFFSFICPGRSTPLLLPSKRKRPLSGTSFTSFQKEMPLLVKRHSSSFPENATINASLSPNLLSPLPSSLLSYPPMRISLTCYLLFSCSLSLSLSQGVFLHQAFFPLLSIVALYVYYSVGHCLWIVSFPSIFHTSR